MTTQRTGRPATTRVWLVTALAVVTVASWPAAAAAATGTRAGDAVVVDSLDLDVPLSEGGSAAIFTLRLPDGASCPGDSANDQYRIQSFVVPAADDPGTLRYEEIKPVGAGRWALYEVGTRPYAQALTDLNDGEGRPGRIGGIPPLSFAVFPPGELPDGRYRVGIACTLARATERFWDTELVLTAVPDDEPGQLRWRATDVTLPDDDGKPDRTVVALSVVAVAAALTTLFVRRTNRRQRAAVSEEER